MSAFTNNLNNATGASNGVYNQQPGQLNEQGINTQGGTQNPSGLQNSNGLQNSSGLHSSTGLHNQQHYQPGQLNENHGIAASGLQGNNLNYTGAPISNVDMIDQQDTRGLSGHNGFRGNHHDGLNQHHGLGTNGVSNEPLQHGVGSNGVSNNPLDDRHHNKTGVPLSGAAGALGAHEYNKHNNYGLGSESGLGHHHGTEYNTGLGQDSGRDNYPTGTAFAGTAASLGSTAQPQTHSRVGDNLAHTGQAKTHGDIDDFASSRSHTNDHHHPGAAAGAAEAGAAALGAHEYGKQHNNGLDHHNHGLGNEHLSKEENVTGRPLGYDRHNNNGLGHNDNLHKDHHAGAGAGAAGVGVAALGEHEHNKHKNNGLSNTGVSDRGLYSNGTHNAGLGQKYDNDYNNKDHHPGVATGTAGAAAAALGSHEYNKHKESGLNDHANTTHAGGAASALKGDHGFSKHHESSGPTTATGTTSNVSTTDEPGVHDSRGVRHAGVPLHDGLMPVQKDSPHQTGATHGERKLSGSSDTSAGSPTKVKTGDKIKGNLEKIVGKVTGNEAKVVEGDMKAHGTLGSAV